jgi:hypothetical protein
MYALIPFLLTMKKKPTVLMAAILAAGLSLATGLAVLPTSVQDAQAQSCITNGESVIHGGGSTSSKSTIEIEQSDKGKCTSNTSVTAESNKGGKTTLNEEEDEYEYEYVYQYYYEYDRDDKGGKTTLNEDQSMHKRLR